MTDELDKQVHLEEELEKNLHRSKHVTLFAALKQVIEIYQKEVTNEELDKFSIVEFGVWFSGEFKLYVNKDEALKEWSDHKLKAIIQYQPFIDELLRDYIDHQRILSNVDLSRKSIRRLMDWAENESVTPTTALSKEEKERPELSEEEASNEALHDNYKKQ